MEIYTSLEQLNLTDKTSVALGNFDGLHVGHRVIMEDAIRSAKENGLKSLCFTFSNHPFNFILQRSDDDPDAVKLICTEEEKIDLVRGMGFDILVNIPFDEIIMKMRAHAFFEDIIIGRLNAGCVSVGFNYTYGARAEGRPEDLVRECSEAGIGVNIHEAVTVGGRVVSSTLIREMISTGNMERTALYLGRPYAFSGTVAHGKNLGAKNGFPTVNIPAPERQMLPPSGVYFSRTVLNGNEYKSISNIGVNPTVNQEIDHAELKVKARKTIETFIFDFDDDIYGDDVTVYFDHFSRGERKFRSKEELFEQISRDCEQARAYHYVQE
ncbi:MAG: bifunctional riboflavin kinase/FAD synthetase [Mogibacterium sp.]|nr:bifunctional riboflavin kinase/FAD synthetase [Mogibacterium sp.]